MKIILQIVSIYFLFNLGVSAQLYTIQNEFHYGDNIDNYLGEVIELEDKSLMLFSYSEDNFSDTTNLYIVKLDSSLNILWEKSHNLNLFFHTVFETIPVIKLTDDDFLIGFANSLIKLDLSGDIIWQKSFENQFTRIQDLAETESGYVLVGEDYVNGDYAGSVVEVDFSGKVIWSKYYGINTDHIISSIEITDDNNFLLCGHTDDVGGLAYQIWTLLLDNTGDIIAENTFGGVYHSYPFPKSLVRTSDGNYIILGSEAGGGFLAKVDPSGKLIWLQEYAAPHRQYLTKGYEQADGTFLLSGSSDPFPGNDPSSKFWIVKTDSIGNEIDEQIFNTSSGWDKGYSLMVGHKCELLFFGSTVQSPNRFDQTILCLENEITSIKEDTNSNNFLVYPNPASDKIQIHNNFSRSTLIQMFDITGRRIMNKMLEERTLSVSHLKPGIYLITLIDEDSQERETMKLVVD